MHKLAQKLTELTKDKFPDTPIIYDDKDSWNKSDNPPLIIRVAYYHGQALQEIKRLLDNGIVFCVQQQGNKELSIGMVVDRNETIDKSLRKNNNPEWNANIKKLVDSKKLAAIILGDKFYSFQTEGACGFYYVKNLQMLNIKATLDYMIELMDKAIKATESK